MNDIIIDSMVEKLNGLETRLEAEHKVVNDLALSVAAITDQSKALKEVIATTKEVQQQISIWKFPVGEMNSLTKELALNNDLRSNPKNEKVVHIHTAGQLLWVLVGLSLLIIFLAIGWRDSFRELKRYEMHDITWRNLKLENQLFLEHLQNYEMNYLKDPGKMKETVKREELRRQQLLEAEQGAKQAEEKLLQLKDQVPKDSSLPKTNEKKIISKPKK